jgi:hypothetical protein
MVNGFTKSKEIFESIVEIDTIIYWGEDTIKKLIDDSNQKRSWVPVLFLILLSTIDPA